MQVNGHLKEWVADTFRADLPYLTPVRDPMHDGQFKVTRGGAWAPVGFAWEGDYGGFPPDGANNVGFRCAADE